MAIASIRQSAIRFRYLDALLFKEVHDLVDVEAEHRLNLLNFLTMSHYFAQFEDLFHEFCLFDSFWGTNKYD